MDVIKINRLYVPRFWMNAHRFEQNKIVNNHLFKVSYRALDSEFSGDPDYTRSVEADLDLIAEGKAVYKTVIAGVDNLLALELGKMQSAVVGDSHPCTCGNGYMQPRTGKFGAFWSCSAKPGCDITLPDDNGKPRARKTAPEAAAGSAHTCPKCGKLMRLVAAKGDRKAFWSCSAYPQCKTSANDKDGAPVFRAVGSA